MEIPDLNQLTATLAGKIIVIILLYLLAYLIYRLSRRIARGILGASRFSARERAMRPERLHTLNGLVAGVITLIAVVMATLISLSLFVDASTLIWIVGLFSAAFGLGARPIVSDFLAGISFLFEDSFDVSEKVELPGLAGGGVMGVVEAVNVRTTVIRAMSGEPLTVPNGEIRVIRNFSRGQYSTANVHVRLATADLGEAIPLLDALGQEALHQLPNLLEPWQVISESGAMGQHTELTLIAKARFGHAGELRPKMLSFIQERLAEEGIELAS